MLCHFSLKSNLRVWLILETWRRYQIALHAVQLSLRKGGGRGEGAELFQGFPNSSEGGSPSREEKPIWNWLTVRFAAAWRLSKFYFFSCSFFYSYLALIIFLICYTVRISLIRYQTIITRKRNSAAKWAVRWTFDQEAWVSALPGSFLGLGRTVTIWRTLVLRRKNSNTATRLRRIS